MPSRIIMLTVINSIVGCILLFTGLIAWIYWQIRFLVVAYRCVPWWFFGCLFLPMVDLAFLVFNFKVARKPYGLSLLGFILAALGIWMGGVVRQE